MMTSPGYPFPSVVVTSGQKELSYTTISTGHLAPFSTKTSPPSAPKRLT